MQLLRFHFIIGNEQIFRRFQNLLGVLALRPPPLESASGYAMSIRTAATMPVNVSNECL